MVYSTTLVSHVEMVKFFFRLLQSEGFFRGMIFNTHNQILDLRLQIEVLQGPSRYR